MATRKWRPRIRPQDVRVGKHFVLSDFLYSETAITEGIANRPVRLDGPEVQGIKGLCTNILDPVVDRFGSTSITFGYCSPVLWRRWYGRDANLYDLHTFKPPRGGVGGAADIVVHANDDPYQVVRWIQANCVYDRLIIYPGSRIVCVAWVSKDPRYHCKEWVFEGEGNDAKYVNVNRRNKTSGTNFSQGDLFT